MPPFVVTETSTVPVAFAGDVAVIVVELTTVTPVAAAAPNVTAVALFKFVPVIVTLVPPAVEPEIGLTAVTVGGATKLNAPDVLPVPFGVVTATLVLPDECVGVVAVIVVEFTTVTPVAAAPPKVTDVAPVKLVPVMVTGVPPAVVPKPGLTLDTVGAGR